MTVERARIAHQRALAAGVGHAVAARAARVIEAEAMVTRYRLRAITERLIPGLEQARAQVALAIDELERSDSTRLRRQASQAPSAQDRFPADAGQSSA